MDSRPYPPKSFTILGAGVCGLYAALRALRAGCQVTLIEKEAYVGGLAAGHSISGKHGENHYDTGVHMLHAFDEEIFQDLKELMGEKRIEVKLDARIRWGKSTYRYPLKFTDLIGEMPPFLLFRGVVGLLLAEFQRSIKSFSLRSLRIGIGGFILERFLRSLLEGRCPVLVPLILLGKECLDSSLLEKT